MAPETLQHPNGTRPRVALSDDPRRASPAPLQTRDINRNPRFSYMETPAELQRSTFNQFSSPTNSSIDESPNFALPPQPFPIISQDKQNGPYPIEKAPPPRTDIPYTIESPHQVHPAHFAPYAEVPIPQQRQEPELPPLPQTPGPIPIKTNEEPMSSMPVSINLPSAGQTKDQSVVSPPRLERRAPTYNPDSLAGPNVAPESHRPGQVSHPNATISPEWKHGLCEFDTTCCVGICCPCMVYGKTQYRLLRKAQKQDPTDLLGYESCNGSCGLMSVLCGFQWVLAYVQHARIRKLYHLDGDFASDCCKSVCCCCCVIMQDEREVRDREELIRRHAGPANGAYVAPGAMTYAPPPR